MLHLFIGNVDNCNLHLADNVEALFTTFLVTDNPINRSIIQNVELRTYNDTGTFIDKFGCKLNLSELSTGCKAVLCAANIHDCIIDFKEAGFNARSEVIRQSPDGYVLMPDTGISYNVSNLEDIDVICDGYHFTKAGPLNNYISNVRPFKLQITEGVERIQA